MGEVPFRLPSGVLQTIPRPMNQILETRPMATVTKDGLYFVLRLSLNSDRVRGQLPMGIT